MFNITTRELRDGSEMLPLVKVERSRVILESSK